MKIATNNWRSKAPKRLRKSPSTSGANGVINVLFGSGPPVSNRRAYNLPGLSPESRVAPDLVQVGNLFFTSGVRGIDRQTGDLPEDPDQQYRNAWRNLAELVEGAGLMTDNIGLVTNFIDSQEYRAFINPGWLELFPDKSNRPARKTTSFPLP